jgi:hypothetical protein
VTGLTTELAANTYMTLETFISLGGYRDQQKITSNLGHFLGLTSGWK